MAKDADTPLRAALRNVACFASLSEESLELLEDEMSPISYQAGNIICEEGDPGNWMFIVDAGHVSVLKRTEEEDLVPIAALGPGDFGGLMSLFEQAPRSATLQARDDVRLWIIDHATFSQLLDSDRQIAMGMLASLSQRIRRDSRSLASIMHYVEESGVERIYHECTPDERMILDTINQKVAAAESLDDVMTFLFESIRQIGACNRLSVAFIEENTARVTSHWTLADYEPLLLNNGYSLDLRNTSLGAVLRSGAPRIINDLEAYFNDHPESMSTQLIALEGIRSSMTCPLIVEGRPIGFLFRSARDADAFDEHQVLMHQAVATRLSQAVDKAYRIEQLSAANRAYYETLGFVSHELRSPLSSVVMDTEVLLRGYMGDLKSAHRGQIEKIARRANQLLGLVDEYMNLAQVESGDLEGVFEAQVDLIQALIEPALDDLRDRLAQKDMRVVRDWDEKSLFIECDPGLMRVVINNLLDNAAKYGAEGGEVRVRVFRTEEGFGVSVWNAGPGFPRTERSHLFRRFSRIKTPELMQQRGTGIGLYTVWRIVQLHGGHIEADSERGEWAEFTFTIPQPPGIPDAFGEEPLDEEAAS